MKPEDTYRSEHPLRNKVARALWSLVWGVCFRISPRPFHGWRRMWLRVFGARIHSTARIYSNVRIWAPWNLEMGPRSGIADGVDCYNVDRVILEENAIVSQHAFLCTASHDITSPNWGLVTAPIRIQRYGWVGAGAYVHMGVTLGEGAVAGACAVVVKNVASWTVVVGNPAKAIKSRRWSAEALQSIEMLDQIPRVLAGRMRH